VFSVSACTWTRCADNEQRRTSWYVVFVEQRSTNLLLTETCRNSNHLKNKHNTCAAQSCFTFQSLFHSLCQSRIQKLHARGYADNTPLHTAGAKTCFCFSFLFFSFLFPLSFSHSKIQQESRAGSSFLHQHTEKDVRIHKLLIFKDTQARQR
jgi:hypothetical protein